jgi:hypothetical protein
MIKKILGGILVGSTACAIVMLAILYFTNSGLIATVAGMAAYTESAAFIRRRL